MPVVPARVITPHPALRQVIEALCAGGRNSRLRRLRAGVQGRGRSLAWRAVQKQKDNEL